MYETTADRVHHRILVGQEARVLREATAAWRDVSPDWISETWSERIPLLAEVVGDAQETVAASSLVASAGALETQGSWEAPGGFLNPRAFAGATADGGSIEALLYEPAITTKELIRGGRAVVPSLEQAGRQLSLLLISTLADVARSAASIQTVLRPNTGYVRIVHGDACDRCLILAGRFYRWNAGFMRHPRCQCSHVSAHLSGSEAKARGMFEDPYEAFDSMTDVEQDAVFGAANAKALREGADIFQVVNSKRGMTPNGLFTTEGATRRGYAGQRLKPGQRRATPELIYRWAGNDRTKAQALLKEHGYILPGGRNPLGSIRGQREGFGAMGRGGTRKAVSQAVLDARRTGIRDPRSRYTMTAAERRLDDAEQDWLKVLQGKNPWVSGGFGNTPDPYGWGLNNIGGPVGGPLTPQIAALVEKRYLAMLTTGGQRFID